MVLELCFGNIFPLLSGYKSYPVFSQHFYSLLFIVTILNHKEFILIDGSKLKITVFPKSITRFGNAIHWIFALFSPSGLKCHFNHQLNVNIFFLHHSFSWFCVQFSHPTYLFLHILHLLMTYFMIFIYLKWSYGEYCFTFSILFKH